MEVHVDIISAFTHGNQGGNPAGVVLNADALSPSQKQRVAACVGLSETAFVSKSNTASVKLEFFTPSKQIAHCGHATVATFSYLHQQAFIGTGEFTKETIDGTRDISVRESGAFMQQLAPQYTSLNEDKADVLKACGLHEDQISAAPMRVDTGNGFIVIGVNDDAILGGLSPDFALMTSLSQKHDLVGFYVFALPQNSTKSDALARMFAPYYGIDEEAATGMAAGPLACYLHDIFGIKKHTFTIEQGGLMSPPSPSLIHVELALKDAQIISLMAGGIGKKIDNRIIRL